MAIRQQKRATDDQLERLDKLGDQTPGPLSYDQAQDLITARLEERAENRKLWILAKIARIVTSFIQAGVSPGWVYREHEGDRVCRELIVHKITENPIKLLFYNPQSDFVYLPQLRYLRGMKVAYFRPPDGEFKKPPEGYIEVRADRLDAIRAGTKGPEIQAALLEMPAYPNGRLLFWVPSDLCSKAFLKKLPKGSGLPLTEQGRLKKQYYEPLKTVRYCKCCAAKQVAPETEKQREAMGWSKLKTCASCKGRELPIFYCYRCGNNREGLPPGTDGATCKDCRDLKAKFAKVSGINCESKPRPAKYRTGTSSASGNRVDAPQPPEEGRPNPSKIQGFDALRETFNLPLNEKKYCTKCRRVHERSSMPEEKWKKFRYCDACPPTKYCQRCGSPWISTTGKPRLYCDACVVLKKVFDSSM